MIEVNMKVIDLNKNSFKGKSNDLKITNTDGHNSEFSTMQNKIKSEKFKDLLKSKMDGANISRPNALNDYEVKKEGSEQSTQISQVSLNVTEEQKINSASDNVEKTVVDKELYTELKKALEDTPQDLDEVMKMLAELLGNLINLNTNTKEELADQTKNIDEKNLELSIQSIGSLDELIKTLKVDNKTTLITDITDSVKKDLSGALGEASSKPDNQFIQILKEMISRVDLTDKKLVDQIKSTLDAYGLMKAPENQENNNIKAAPNERVETSGITIPKGNINLVEKDAQTTTIKKTEVMYEKASNTMPQVEGDTKPLLEVSSKEMFVKSMVELLVRLTSSTIENDTIPQDKSNGVINIEVRETVNKLFSFLQKKTSLNKLEDTSTKNKVNKGDSSISKDILKNTAVNNLMVTNFRLDKDTTVPSKEDKLLRSLILRDEDNKNSKVNNLMLQLNNSKEAISSVVAPEELLVSKNNLPSDILKAVKYMNLNNIKELTVKVTPNELGEIVIKLSMETGVMKASIAARNKETYNLLNSNLGDIKNALSNSEIKIQNVSINIYQEDTTFFNDGFNQNGKGGNNHRNQNSRAQVDAGFADEDTSKLVINENNLSILV